MNKLIPLMLIFLVSVLTVFSLPDLIALDSEWVDEYGQPIGNSVSIYQGESAEYYMMIVTDTDLIGYKVWLSQNGHVIDIIIPHTNISEDHYFAYEGVDTPDYAPGEYIVKIGANNDGVEDAYDRTVYLYLEILPVQEVNEPPYTPSNPIPTNGAENIEYVDIDFSWNGGDPDGDEVTYDFYIGYREDTLFLFGEDLEDPAFNMGELDKLTTFYWQVIAKDSEYSVESQVWSFTTKDYEDQNNPPYAPNSPNPEDNAVEVNTDVTLSWNGGDPDGDEVTYDVWFGIEGESMERIGNDLVETSYYVDGLNYETNYIWLVIANDGMYWTFGSNWEFQTREEPTENQPPYEPNNPNPADNAVEVNTDVTLSWSGGDPDGDEVTYDVWFAESGQVLELVAEDISETYFAVENLELETLYYWKIVASDSEYEIESPVWSFTTRNEDIEENHNPTIENISNQRIKCNRNFRLLIDAEDEDNDNLTFYDNTGLFDIDSETGEISFKPKCSDRGTYYVTITVVDEHGGEDSDTFRLKIYRDNSGDDDEDEDNIESVIEYGECIDDNDGDSLGIRQVIYTLLESNTERVISVQSSEEICQLIGDEIPVYEFKGFVEDELITVILVVIIFLMITLPLALYVFNKIS
jgi:hypothetical protein